MGNSRILGVLIGVVLVFLVAGLGLSANPFTVEVSVAASTSVTVNTDSVSFLVAAFQTGPTSAQNVSVTAYTNKKRGYTISVSGNDFTADSEGDASTFPLSTLQFNDGTDWKAMSTTPQTAHSGPKTGPGGDTFNIPVRLNLSGNEASGVYTTTVTVTIANP